MDPNSPEIQAELAQRHKATATVVVSLFVTTILLSILAFVLRPHLEDRPPNLPLDMAVRIVILILGLGAVVWRRTKFSPMRLADIVGLQGVTGLLATLQKTTIQIAILADSIAVIGFLTTLLTGNELYTFWAGAISIVVLVYCFPTKSSWLRTVQRYTDRRTDPTLE